MIPTLGPFVPFVPAYAIPKPVGDGCEAGTQAPGTGSEGFDPPPPGAFVDGHVDAWGGAVSEEACLRGQVGGRARSPSFPLSPKPSESFALPVGIEPTTFRLGSEKERLVAGPLQSFTVPISHENSPFHSLIGVDSKSLLENHIGGHIGGLEFLWGSEVSPKRYAKGRSPHKGVKLKQRKLPSGAVAWRAIFDDPDTGKETYVTLDALALPSADARKRWAVAKAQTLARRRMELASGAPRNTRKPLGEAVDDYFAAHTRLRERTLAIYTVAATKLREWASKVGIESTDDVTKAKLLAFRQSVADEPKRVSVKGGKRGQRVKSSEKRSPVAVNQDLRAAATVLGWMAEGDLLPKLSRDDLSRALRPVEAPRELPTFLSHSEIRALLEVALAHDEERFAITREEHLGLKPVGSTRKYEPAAPLALFCLLSGCRAGEAFGLAWSGVDLEGVGRIRLEASGTKTKIGRMVSLEVSPVLRSLLDAMKGNAGENAYVFGGKRALSRSSADAISTRLEERKAPKNFSWQVLRSTCQTFLTNAPGIYGGASAFAAAKRAGHSVAVAEARYAGLVDGIPSSARTLEAAMQIEDLAHAVVAAAKTRNA